MSNISWPSSFPPPLVGTFKPGFRPAYTQDDPEVGPGRRRKRYTRTLKKWSFTIDLGDQQLVDLDRFVEVETNGGVLNFEWTHPNTEQVHLVRFAELPEPKELSDGSWSADILLDEV